MIAEEQHAASLKSGIVFYLLLSLASRLLILRLLLMSRNVHANPGLVFSRSICADKVTWKGTSVQCCTCSKLIHSRCSLLSFSRFKTLGSSLTFGAVLLAAFLLLLEVSHLPALCFSHQACLPPLFNLAHSGFSLQMPRTYPIFAFKHSTLFPPTLYFLPLNFPYPLIFLTAFLPFLVSHFLLPLTRSGFFNKMPEVFEPT